MTSEIEDHGRRRGRSEVVRRVLDLRRRRLDDEIAALIPRIRDSKDGTAVLIVCEPAFADDVEDHWQMLEDAGRRKRFRRFARAGTGALLVLVSVVGILTARTCGRPDIASAFAIALLPGTALAATGAVAASASLMRRMKGREDPDLLKDVASLLRRKHVDARPVALYRDRVEWLEGKDVAKRMLDPADRAERRGPSVVVESRSGVQRLTFERPVVLDASGRRTDLDPLEEVVSRMRSL